jgi:membrane protein YqaA with SNARE-associated domain
VLGRYLIHFKDRRWFPIKGKYLQKATSFYQKWGVWTLLLAWVPFIGDPLTLVAGIFRTNPWIFLLLVTLGKAARYSVIIALL